MNEIKTQVKSGSFSYTAVSADGWAGNGTISVNFDNPVKYAFIKSVSTSHTSYQLSVSEPTIYGNNVSCVVYAAIGGGKTCNVSVTFVGIY